MATLSETNATKTEITPETSKEKALAAFSGVVNHSYALAMESVELSGADSSMLATEAWHIKDKATQAGQAMTDEESLEIAKAKLQQKTESKANRIEEIREETKALTEKNGQIMEILPQLGISTEEISLVNNEVRQKLVNKILEEYREATALRIRLSLGSALAPNTEESRKIAYIQNKYNDKLFNLPAIGLQVFGVDREQFDAINQEVTQQIKGELLESYKKMCTEEAELHKFHEKAPQALKNPTVIRIQEIQKRRIATGDFLIGSLQVNDASIRLIRDQILNKKEFTENQVKIKQKEVGFFRRIFNNLRSVFVPKTGLQNPQN